MKNREDSLLTLVSTGGNTKATELSAPSRRLDSVKSSLYESNFEAEISSEKYAAQIIISEPDLSQSVELQSTEKLIHALRLSTFRNRTGWVMFATIMSVLLVLSPTLGLKSATLVILSFFAIILTGFQLSKNEKIERICGAIVYENYGKWYWPKYRQTVVFRTKIKKGKMSY